MLVIDDDSTRDDLELALGYLREKAAQARRQGAKGDAVVAAVHADIDSVLTAWEARAEVTC